VRRRQFITFLGGAATTWPLAARAQQAAMPVVGLLSISGPGVMRRPLSSFRDRLKDAGYVEGQNVVVEYVFAEGQFDRLQTLVSELVERHVAVLVHRFLETDHMRRIHFS
jgi:putative ABC transport system substrate-binding protein